MAMARHLGVWSLLAAMLTAGAALAAPSASELWGAVKLPARGPARAIGDYSGGCIRGAQALPLDGPGYQVMHPSRRRNYGHPHLLRFVRELGKAVADAGHGPLLVGDLGQPRGGRASGGHASHQTGLDVDVWYWHPPRARRGALSTEDREALKSRSILNGKTGKIRERWKAPVTAMLRLAAESEHVERIFVHPIIKRDLCESAPAGESRAWLRAIRPWYGHDDHFHARLACPADSPECQPQDATPPGDGCDALDWWFDAEAQAERRRERSRYRQKVVSGAGWPEACNALLPGAKAE